MRTIKFRAWDKEHKKMLYDGYGAIHNLGFWNEVIKSGHYELYQFTGLLDKNGKEIYEGDIVKFDGHTFEEKFTASIEFKDGKFCDNYYGWEIGKYREVIGNIHENPELIKSL